MSSSFANFTPSNFHRVAEKVTGTTEFGWQKERNARLDTSRDHPNRGGPDIEERERLSDRQQLHLALVCFKSPETADDHILDGFALTISQMLKLGMQLIIVLDLNVSAHVSYL